MMKYFLALLRSTMVKKPWKVANNYHSVLSIVNGPKSQMQFDIIGKDRQKVKVTKLAYFVPGIGNLGCGISTII